MQPVKQSQQQQQQCFNQQNQPWPQQQQQQQKQMQQQQQQSPHQSWSNHKPAATTLGRNEQPPSYSSLVSPSAPSSEYNHQPLSPKTLTPTNVKSAASTGYYNPDVEYQSSGYEHAYETPTGRNNQTTDDLEYDELR